MHHLDTSTVVAFLRGDLHVAEQIACAGPSTVISTPVLAELHHGIHASRKAIDNLARLHELTARITVLAFDEFAAKTYGRIRHELKLRGTLIGEMDLLIASLALNHKAILVTHNTKHFSRVSSLMIEDWVRS